MSGAFESSRRTPQDVPLPGGDFRLFVTRLSFQAMISLGLVENPITGTRSVNAGSARMLVDDLRMLREKTRGNLDPEEETYIEKVSLDLDRHFERIVGESTDELDDGPADGSGDDETGFDR